MAEKEAVKEGEADSKDTSLVADVLRTLTKTIKTFNTYPKDNPVYQKFAGELSEKFNSFFQSHDSLTLNVGQYALLYEGKEVFESNQRSDNIALLLYADGIRELTFLRGFNTEEITDFIDILRIAPRSENLTDDIMTLLWEKNIPHINYVAAEEATDEPVFDDASLVSELEDMATTLYGASYSDLTIKRRSLGLKLPPLTDNELSQIRNELFSTEEKTLISHTMDMLVHLVMSGEASPEVVEGIGNMLDIRMQNNDIKGAIAILKKLKAAAGTQHIKPILKKMGNIENIKKVFELSADPQEIEQYLILLDREAISNMVAILGDLQDRKQRRLLCNVLIEMGKEDIGAFERALSDSKWYLVRNVVLILGMTKNPSAVRYIEKTIHHPELRVRREAVRSLENIQSNEAKRPLMAALKDADSNIRSSALRALRKFGGREIFDIIKTQAMKEDFHKKSYSEKRELLETLAKAGGRDAFPILANLFKKKGLFEKDEHVETRACAAYGLGITRSPDALSLLQKETNSRKSLLREACQQALKYMEESKDDKKA